MEALLSIKLPADMQTIGDIEASMGNMAKGMAAFGKGIGIASIGKIIEGLSKKVGKSEKTVAEQIKEDVELLTSIKVTTQNTSTFSDAMGNISDGLGKFAGGSILASIITAFSQKIGTEPWTAAIKKDVNNLMSIVGDDSEASVKKSAAFITIMGNLAAGLGEFTKAGFVGGLEKAFSIVLKWLGAGDTPVQAAVKLASDADALQKVGSGLMEAAKGLEIFAKVGDLSDIDLKEFTSNLKESLPDLERSIMGGYVDTSGWGGIDVLGLASPKIRYKKAAENLNALVSAASGSYSGETAAGPQEGQMISMSSLMSESMIIKTAIIESAIIQGPLAIDIGPGPGAGVTVNTNNVTVAPSTSNSISSVTRTENTYGTTDPYTALPSAF